MGTNDVELPYASLWPYDPSPLNGHNRYIKTSISSFLFIAHSVILIYIHIYVINERTAVNITKIKYVYHTRSGSV